MTDVEVAYPSFRTFADNDGKWLLAKSSIIDGLAREATFLVALPYRPGAGPRAWGFWSAAGLPTWIGPRHTNLGDGSICAFSAEDGAWSEGDDLRTLFDLYSVWAARHLHLEVIGRWPGKQYSFGSDPKVRAYYRLMQNQPDELCGCGSETKRYSECCKPFDEKLNRIELMMLWGPATPSGGFTSRKPPPSVVDFIEGHRAEPPPMAEVHSAL